MKDVLALQKLESNNDFNAYGWTTLTWTFPGADNDQVNK